MGLTQGPATRRRLKIRCRMYAEVLATVRVGQSERALSIPGDLHKDTLTRDDEKREEVPQR